MKNTRRHRRNLQLWPTCAKIPALSSVPVILEKQA